MRLFVTTGVQNAFEAKNNFKLIFKRAEPFSFLLQFVFSHFFSRLLHKIFSEANNVRLQRRHFKFCRSIFLAKKSNFFAAIKFWSSNIAHMPLTIFFISIFLFLFNSTGWFYSVVLFCQSTFLSTLFNLGNVGSSSSLSLIIKTYLLAFRSFKQCILVVLFDVNKLTISWLCN